MSYFSSQASSRVIAAIRQRVPDFNHCPVCRTNKWTLANGLVAMPFRPFPVMDLPAWITTVAGSTGTLGEEQMPAYALVCDRCSYIQFFSANALGSPHLPGMDRLIPPVPPQRT